MLSLFGPEACGTLGSQPGMGPVPSALEGKILTTAPPRKPSVTLF